MILSEPQVERYARQILLAEIGGKGQERLLDSTVAIRGRGDAAQLCAAWLAGAGIGRLVLPESDPASRLVPAGIVADRNPDCRIVTAGSNNDLEIWFEMLPSTSHKRSALLWAGTRDRSVRWIRLGRAVACGHCVARNAGLPGSEGSRAAAVLCGATIAVEALRLLLGLVDDRSAELLSFDLARGFLERRRIEPEPACALASSA